MDIRNHAIESLEQLVSAISPLSLSEYSLSLPTLHEISIGKHVRHVVEFFECLSKSQQHSVVNYDNRKRDLRLENNIDFTINRILELQSEIAVYQDQILSLEVDYGSGSQTISTTLYRELVYNIEHCVHHLAIIKIGVEVHFPSVHLSENLGVAYSTQQYQNAS